MGFNRVLRHEGLRRREVLESSSSGSMIFATVSFGGFKPLRFRLAALGFRVLCIEAPSPESDHSVSILSQASNARCPVAYGCEDDDHSLSVRGDKGFPDEAGTCVMCVAPWVGVWMPLSQTLAQRLSSGGMIRYRRRNTQSVYPLESRV